MFADGKESGRASLVDLIAPQGPTLRPSRTVPIIGSRGTPIAELAVQHLEIWRAGTRTSEALRLTGAVLWRD